MLCRLCDATLGRRVTTTGQWLQMQATENEQRNHDDDDEKNVERVRPDLAGGRRGTQVYGSGGGVRVH